MSSEKIIGVDPGLDGAVAVLDGGKLIEVADIPTFEITVGGTNGGARKRRRRVDTNGLLGLLDRHADAKCLVLEEVHAMPKMGVASMFSFGRTLGNIETCVQALKIPLHYAAPNVWKKDLRVSADKDAARMRASDLLPDGYEWWQRKKDHNRAEAALIALYGAKVYL